ncbi:MAG: hypothetical protein RLZZ502_1601 [Pseudomonadota bacterium]
MSFCRDALGRSRVSKWMVLCLLCLSALPSIAVELKYALWDANQLPAYQHCAKDFQAQHPDIQIKFQQLGWGDYWTAISTGVIAGTAPDVLTNHLAKYPELMKNGALLDLGFYLRRDRFDVGIYEPGLFENWSHKGEQYGLPKDWDTIGLIVNMRMAKAAGVTREDLWGMRWNPQDGGSFEQVVRKLSQDKDGQRGHEPGFKKHRVRVYGYQNPGPGGMMGQTEWSHFALSTGWTLQSAPWAVTLNYADARLADTLSYLASLADKGYSARFELTRSLGAGALFMAQRVAMIPEGSWMVNYFAHNARFEHAWVPLPIGPSGLRATLFNGLADSIWSGTKHPEQAWAWVKYLGSAACQKTVATYGVVNPAVRGLAQESRAVLMAKGVDSSAFLEMADTRLSRLAPPPIVPRAAEINEIVGNAIEAVLIGKLSAAEALRRADKKVNELLR